MGLYFDERQNKNPIGPVNGAHLIKKTDKKAERKEIRPPPPSKSSNKMSKSKMPIKTKFYTAFISAVLLLTACEGYRTPSASQDPAKLSDTTLCYRAETTGKIALKDEVRRRALDCRDYIEDDPLYTGRSSVTR